jgi:hypothetical protein
MDAYGGFEPEVGEVRALRSFRVGPGGWLYPLFHTQRWTDGTNSALCNARAFTGSPLPTPPSHQPPEPECSCGFYAYASAPGDAESPYADNVLATVACWGRVIAGTRGIRCEYSRIEALWLSEQVPTELAAMVAERYPSVEMYSDKAALLAKHPPTQLDCYETPSPGTSLTSIRALRVVIGLAVIAASVPLTLVPSIERPYLVGAAVGLWLLIGVAALRRHATPVDRTRQALIALAVMLWMVAPLADRTGGLLLRIPLLQIGCLLYVHRTTLRRAARQFPATIG